MEFLIPGFLLLLISVLIVFLIIPRLGPMTTLIGASLLLTGGILHHYKLFRFEYQNATWADRLKAYGPGILYFIMSLFIIGFIFSLWGGPSVPIPDAPAPAKEPNTPSPSPSNSPLSAITNSLNVVKNTAANALADAGNMGRQFVANVKNYVPNVFQGQQPGAPAMQQQQPQQQQQQAPRNAKNVSFFSQY